METLSFTHPKPNIALVTLNRPKTLNSMSIKLYEEIESTFNNLSKDPNIRVIIITGSEKSFTSGTDLGDFASLNIDEPDPARKTLRAQRNIAMLQNALSSIENCIKPVIAAVSGYCIGAGTSLVSACDIRYCTKTASFSIKEVVMGIAADVGVLQRLPKYVGNNSWIRELVYTGRSASAQECFSHGVFSKIFDSHAEMIKASLELAEDIASKSPIAVIGSKMHLNYSRDHTVEESRPGLRPDPPQQRAGLPRTPPPPR